MYEDLVNEFYPFAKKQLGFDQDPKIKFMDDQENAQNPMGYTAHYNPSSMVVTIYTTGRHPKDILRSLSHELVHHAQNCRGEDLSINTHDIDTDPNLKTMEDEAFHVGSGRLMKRYQKHRGGYPMTEEKQKTPKGKETQTESKDYHTSYHSRKNSMLHDMLLRKFGLKKGE